MAHIFRSAEVRPFHAPASAPFRRYWATLGQQSPQLLSEINGLKVSSGYTNRTSPPLVTTWSMHSCGLIRVRTNAGLAYQKLSIIQTLLLHV